MCEFACGAPFWAVQNKNRSTFQCHNTRYYTLLYVMLRNEWNAWHVFVVGIWLLEVEVAQHGRCLCSIPCQSSNKASERNEVAKNAGVKTINLRYVGVDGLLLKAQEQWHYVYIGTYSNATARYRCRWSECALCSIRKCNREKGKVLQEENCLAACVLVEFSEFTYLIRLVWSL